MARQAVLELIADASKLKSTLNDTEGHTDKFGSSMGKLGGVIAGALSGAAVLKFGSDSVKAFTESEQAQSKLELALKNNSATVGVHASEFAKLNTQLAKHTLADDDVIAATEAQMATFGASKSQIQQMIPTVLDFAAKMGVDAPEAADLFDKASLGSAKALKTLGIEGYKPTGDKATDLANIQGLLKDKVSGAAQAQLDAAGPGATMKKSMDELQETVGKYLVPALQKMADIGVAVTDFLAQHPLVTAFAIAGGVLAGAIWAIQAATNAWAVIQGVLNVVLEANPIGLIAVALGVLVLALIAAWQKSETFRDIVKNAFQAVVNGITDGVGWILDGVAKVLGGFATMADAATHIPGIGDQFKGVADTIRGLQHDVQGWAANMHTGLDLVRRDADSTAGALKQVRVPPGFIGPLAPGQVPSNFIGPLYPGHAAGGPISGLSMVGEEGPELFVGHGTIIPNNALGGIGGTTIVNNYTDISVATLDPVAAAPLVINAIKEYERRNGQGWRAA